MKRLPLVLLGAAGLVGGVYLYEQVNIAKKFTYRIIGFSVGNVNADNIQLLVGFELNNASSFSVKVSEVLIYGYLQGVYAGNITNNSEIIIPANGVGNIQLTITLINKQLLTNIASIVGSLGNLSTYDIDLIGYFKVKTFLFPIKIPIRYSTTGKNLVNLYTQAFG